MPKYHLKTSNQKKSKNFNFNNLLLLSVALIALIIGVYLIKSSRSFSIQKKAANTTNKYLVLTLDNDGKFVSKSVVDDYNDLNIAADTNDVLGFTLINSSNNKPLELVSSNIRNFTFEDFSNKNKMVPIEATAGYQLVFKLTQDDIKNAPNLKLKKDNKEVAITSANNDDVNIAGSIHTEYIFKNLDNRPKEKALDIAFLDIGFGENGLDEYKQLVTEARANFLTSDFYKQNANRINLIRIDSKLLPSDIGCINSSIFVYECADNDNLTQLRQGANADLLVGILNTTKYIGGYSVSGYLIPEPKSTIVTKISFKTRALAHEISHILAKLNDEKVLENKGISNSAFRNCSKSCNFPNGQCFKGCTSSNYFRSSEVSIMNEAGIDTKFNDISLKYLYSDIEKYAPSNRIAATIKSPTSGVINLPVTFNLTAPSTKDATYVTLNISSNRGNLYISPNLLGVPNINIAQFINNQAFIADEKITVKLITTYPDGTTGTNFYYFVAGSTEKAQWCAANIGSVDKNRIEVSDITAVNNRANKDCPLDKNGQKKLCLQSYCYSEGPYCKGDVNGDSKIDLLDITWVGNHYNLTKNITCP